MSDSQRHATPDTVECMCCRAQFPPEHFRLGMRLSCPVCHQEQVPRLVHPVFFWWDVTLSDFWSLLLDDDDTREAASRRVLDRLGWTLNCQGEASFVDGAGRRHSLEAAQLLIQRTPEWQFDLYQMVRGFWR